MSVHCPDCDHRFSPPRGVSSSVGAVLSCPACGGEVTAGAGVGGANGHGAAIFDLPPRPGAALQHRGDEEDDLFALGGRAAAAVAVSATDGRASASSSTPPPAAVKKGLRAWFGRLFGGHP